MTIAGTKQIQIQYRTKLQCSCNKKDNKRNKKKFRKKGQSPSSISETKSYIIQFLTRLTQTYQDQHSFLPNTKTYQQGQHNQTFFKTQYEKESNKQPQTEKRSKLDHYGRSRSLKPSPWPTSIRAFTPKVLAKSSAVINIGPKPLTPFRLHTSSEVLGSFTGVSQAPATTVEDVFEQAAPVGSALSSFFLFLPLLAGFSIEQDCKILFSTLPACQTIEND
jgi:hypothetical protein